MEDSSGLTCTYLYSLIALIFYTTAFLFFLTTKTLAFTPIAVLAFTVSGLANTLAFLAYNKSIKIGELSTVIPFTKLNPIFTGILAGVFLAESITIVNAVGIAFVTLGSYVILKDEKHDLFDSVRRFKASNAPKLGAASAFIFSIAAIADRFATQTISPKIYTYLIYLFMTAGLTAYVAANDKQVFKEAREKLPKRENTLQLDRSRISNSFLFNLIQLFKC